MERQLPRQVLNVLILERKLPECRLEFVQRVSNLVDRELLGPVELPIRERLLLEEEPDLRGQGGSAGEGEGGQRKTHLVARVEKVRVSYVLLVGTRTKDGHGVTFERELVEQLL